MPETRTAQPIAHPTTEKKAQIETLSKTFGGARGVFLIDFTGLDAVKTTELRRKIKAGGGRYFVAKNSLAARAAKGTLVEGLSELLVGTTGFVVGADDPAVLAKVLHGFAKENESFKFKGGAVEGAKFGAKDLEAVSNLPSKDQARAMLIGILQAPASKLARLLNAPSTGVARCIDARGKQSA